MTGPVSDAASRGYNQAMQGPTIIALEGHVDVAGVAAHGARIDEAIGEGAGHVVLDLTRVDFLDSTGLSLLTRTQRRLNRSGRRLAVVPSPNGAAQRALDATGLVHMLEVYPSVEAATAEFADAPRVGR